MIKKSVFIIVSIVLVLSVILVVLSYNTLEKREKAPLHGVDSPIKIEYMVNVISFDKTIQGGVLEGNHIEFTEGNYGFISVDLVENLYLTVGDIEFTRYRLNSYNSDSDAVQYTEGVPVYIAANVFSYSDSPAGRVYNVKIDKYYTEFTFEQFAKSSNYVIDYQKFMDEYEPNLQPPFRGSTSSDDLLDVTRRFFNYIGEYIEYLTHRLEFYLNYIVFYVQDYSLLFSLKKEAL